MKLELLLQDLSYLLGLHLHLIRLPHLLDHILSSQDSFSSLIELDSGLDDGLLTSRSDIFICLELLEYAWLLLYLPGEISDGRRLDLVEHSDVSQGHVLDEVLVHDVQLLLGGEITLLASPPAAPVGLQLGDDLFLRLLAPALPALEPAVELDPPRRLLLFFSFIFLCSELLLPLGPLRDLLPELDQLLGQHLQLGLVDLVVRQPQLLLPLLQLVVHGDEALLWLDNRVIVLDLLQQPVLVLHHLEDRRLLIHEFLELEDPGPLGLQRLSAPLLWPRLLDLLLLLLVTRLLIGRLFSFSS